MIADWRVPGYWAMYHEGKYLLAIAEGYLEAEQRIYGEIDGNDEILDLDLALQRSELAGDLLRGSLSLSPAQVDAWTSLAWSEAFQGNTDGVVDALKTSWQVAPYSIAQAESRLIIADVIGGPEDAVELTGILADAGARNDLRTLKRYRPTLFNYMIEGSERHKLIAENAGLTP